MSKKQTNWLDVAKECSEEVMKVLGPNFNETFYHEALMHEFRLKEIPYERGRTVEIFYKGYSLTILETDCILNPSWHPKRQEGEEFLLEFKGVKSIEKSHIMQTQVYLASLNLNNGAVLNFNTGMEKIDIERVQKPSTSLQREVKTPSKKQKPKNTEKILKSAAKEVMDYLGTEFFYDKTGTNAYFAAIGVELRLQGIFFHSVSQPVLYKHHRIKDHVYEFLLENGDAVNVVAVKNEKELDEKVDEIKAVNKLTGILKSFLLVLPQKDGMDVMVKEV